MKGSETGTKVSKGSSALGESHLMHEEGERKWYWKGDEEVWVMYDEAVKVRELKMKEEETQMSKGDI